MNVLDEWLITSFLKVNPLGNYLKLTDLSPLLLLKLGYVSGEAFAPGVTGLLKFYRPNDLLIKVYGALDLAD